MFASPQPKASTSTKKSQLLSHCCQYDRDNFLVFQKSDRQIYPEDEGKGLQTNSKRASTDEKVKTRKCAHITSSPLQFH